jgi:hypothetical protein
MPHRLLSRRLALAMFVSLALAGCGNRHAREAPANLDRGPSQGGWRAFDDLPLGSSPRSVTAEAFDQVRSGMTLGELTELLGRGRLSFQYSGTGTIRWECADGRQLSVLPVTYGRDEIIRVDGGSVGIGRMWMTAEKGRRPVEVPKKGPA